MLTPERQAPAALVKGSQVTSPCDPDQMIQLLCRFRAADQHFESRARPALELLAAQPTCQSLRFARSTEDASVWVLTAEFDTFAGYRSALSPFDVRTTVVPFLSEAEQSSSGVLEVVLDGRAGALVEHETVVDPTVVARPR